ncbi:hypothetical protein PACTADRAFT_51051 [Pachysolen tannophilus NRRL Y-2460]|uniref:Uncharacterized protein n=1 Tax=Pachysolen tannophilus NRRL Y-2460 TaxID=669874 RepID=A0A1E4TR77_PACTA|nr:hypothetical protein PACTADRAFT_51051 [Pachysolen tannophilus NRRL Y-2460]
MFFQDEFCVVDGKPCEPGSIYCSLRCRQLDETTTSLTIEQLQLQLPALEFHNNNNNGQNEQLQQGLGQRNNSAVSTVSSKMSTAGSIFSSRSPSSYTDEVFTPKCNHGHHFLYDSKIASNNHHNTNNENDNGNENDNENENENSHSHESSNAATSNISANSSSKTIPTNCTCRHMQEPEFLDLDVSLNSSYELRDRSSSNYNIIYGTSVLDTLKLENGIHIDRFDQELEQNVSINNSFKTAQQNYRIWLNSNSS